MLRTEAQPLRGRWVAASLASAAACALAWFVWSQGMGRYLDRYCSDRPERPLGAESGEPDFRSPVHLHCTFGDRTGITVLDVRPLLWALVVVVALAVVIGAAWLSAGAGSTGTGDDRAVRSRAVLAVTGLVLAYPSVHRALLSAPVWWVEYGLDQLRHDGVALLAVTLSGLAAGLCFRQAAGTRVRWPWPALALLAPAWCVASTLDL